MFYAGECDQHGEADRRGDLTGCNQPAIWDTSVSNNAPTYQRFSEFFPIGALDNWSNGNDDLGWTSALWQEWHRIQQFVLGAML